jgi:hypothetical protein
MKYQKAYLNQMKNNLLKSISILFLFSTTIRCKQELNNIKTEEKEIVVEVENNFEDKLKNESKIFLKYWKGATYDEYHKINELLIGEGVLERNAGLYYKMGLNKMMINPFFFSDSFVIGCDGRRGSQGSRNHKDNDVIDGIELSGFDEDIYNIFKEKYNLPNLVFKKSADFILEENPLYNNSKADEKVAGTLIRALDENEIHEIFELNKSSEWYNGVGYVPNINMLSIKKNIVIEKDNVVILFRVCNDICSNSYATAWFYYKNNDRNSKYRIVVFPDNSMLTVTYFDKDVYNKAMKEKESHKNNYLRKLNEEEENNKKRLNESIDEI